MPSHDVIVGLLATHALLIVGGLIMLLLLAGMLRQQRNPAASAAWLIFMISMPYVGVPLYLFFGSRKLKALAREQDLPAPRHGLLALAEHSDLQRFLLGLKVPPPTSVTALNFHRDADAARTGLLEMLASAQHSIDLAMFILARDQVGHRIIDTLTERARAGVHVRVLLDSVGSFYLFKWHLRHLLKAGAEVRWFMPVLHRPLRGQTNLRNHRKLVITDNRHVWSGGRNLADSYLQQETQTRWIDFSFDISGSVCADYIDLFNTDWTMSGGRPRPKTLPVPVSAPLPVTEVQFAQVLASGPNRHDDVLHDTLVRLFMGAQECITIVSPYFVPSEILQVLLIVSARSGVRVEILIPERSNHMLADLARQRFLRRLHSNGVAIRCLPDSMMHAKIIIIDQQCALVGSANFDLRSLYLNFELMTLLYAPAHIHALSEWVEALQRDAKLWRPPAPGVIRETLEGLALIAAFQL